MSIESQLARLVGPLPDGVSEGVALGTGLADGYDIYDSPVGRVAVAFNPSGISSVDLADADHESRFAARHHRRLIQAQPPSKWGEGILAAIEEGTTGELPVDLRSVTSFQAAILRIAASIPRGEVRPYAWLARQADRPRAARAVGSTMARNPVPLVVPCHRVVRSDGHLGSYSLGGPHNKRELLDHEGADIHSLESLASRGVRVQANRSTGIYCYPACRAIRRSQQENVIDFRSTGEATSEGYRPCEICRPG